MPTIGADTLLPADELRGLSPGAVADELAEADGDGGYAFGMVTPAGAARVRLMTLRVRDALDAGLGREVAISVLLGECARLRRDGHGEYDDTVVRESIAVDLREAFERAGVAPVTDDEVAELGLLMGQATIRAVTRQALTQAGSLLELERACAVLDQEARGVRPEGLLGTSIIRQILAGVTYEQVLDRMESPAG